MQENIQPQINSNQDDEISLKELVLRLKKWWNYLFSKWLIIVLTGILGGLAGFVYALIKKPIYIAELTFALEEDNGGSLGAYAGLASQFGIDLGGGTGGIFSGDNIIELMKSRSMIQKTLLSPVVVNGKSQSLADYYIDFNSLREKWRNDPHLVNISFPLNSEPEKFNRTQDSLLGKFHKFFIKNNLSVGKIDKKLSVVEVKCSFSNELFAKTFTESLVNNVTTFYIKTKTGRSQKSVAVLQKKADSLRTALDNALYARARSVDQTPDLNPVRQVATVGGQKKQVDIQVLSTAYGEVLKNLELSKITLSREAPFIQIIDKPILPLDEVRIGSVKGCLIGCVIVVFLTVIILVGRRAIHSLMK